MLRSPAARRRAGPALRGARRGRRASGSPPPRTSARSRPGSRAAGGPAIDLAASYGRDAARPWSLGAHADAAHPRRAPTRGCAIPPPPPPPDPRAARRGRRGAPAARRSRRAGRRRPRRAQARGGAARPRERSATARRRRRRCPGALDAAELKGGAKALEHRRLRGVPRRPGRAYRAACADHHARPALALLDALLDALRRARTPRPRRRARRSTSTTSSCASRDLLARPGAARALGRALRADHGRRVPGHEPAPARDPRGARARQPVRGRRRVPVDLPLPARRRGDLPRARARRSTRRGARPDRQLPLARGAARRAQRGVRARARRAASRRCGPAARAPIDATARCGCSTPDPPRRAAGRAARHRARRAGTSARRLGLAGARRPAVAPRRGARWSPHRLRAEVDAGRRAGDIVVLVRATALAAAARGGARGAGPADLRRRRPRLLVAGAGPRRPRLAARARQPARRGGAADAVLASPFCGAGTDALVLLADAAAARASARGPRCGARSPSAAAARGAARGRGGRLAGFARFAAASGARRAAAASRCCSSARSSRTGYDLAILARPGGDRRLANLRKLMRLAREYERAEGRDLRGFLADAAGPRPRRGARGRGGARVRGPRRRAADDDPPRQGARVPGRLRRRPRPPAGARAARRCWSARTATPGCGSRPLGGGDTIPTLALGAARRRARPRPTPRRSGACSTSPMTRARELLILSGGTDTAKWPAPRARRPADRLDRAARCSASPRAGAIAERATGTAARARVARAAQHAGDARAPRTAAAPAPRARRGAPRHRAARRAEGRPAAPARPRRRRSGSRYSQLTDYASCGYRFYLRARASAAADVDAAAARASSRSRPSPASSTRALRGSLVHRAARGPRLRPPRAARRRHGPRARRRAGRRARADARSTTSARSSRRSPRSPLCARLAAARRVTPRGRLRVRARARRRRPARPRLRRRARARGRRHAPGRRLQDRPPRRGRRPRPSYIDAQLRDPAARLRARRAAGRRAARRGRLLPARAPRRAGHRRRSRAARRARARRRAAARSPTASSTHALPGHRRARTASCAATAPAARRCCSRPEPQTLRTLQAYASAGSLAGSTGPS